MEVTKLRKGPRESTPQAPLSTQKGQVITTIEFYRGMIMDLAEMKLGKTPEWEQTRRQFLSLLGDKGLEGKIKNILA